MPRRITVAQCESMDIREVWKLYREFVNPAQVDLLSSFASGRDLVERSEGVWIYTRDGKKILDFSGGVGVLNHGHNHPRILKARLAFQKQEKMEVHKSFLSPYIAALSHNIAQLLPLDLDYCFFPNSGAEAVEGAVKMAYKYHQGLRKYILHSDISFHGKLLGAGGLTASPEVNFVFPTIPHTAPFEFDSIESIRTQVSKFRKEDGSSDVYAIIVEPFSASSLRPCSEQFLQALRELCSNEDIVLIFDEVYTGWAKTGELFYFMHYDVVPDILTMAKSFGGGKASISGYVARKHVFLKAYGNQTHAYLHSTTYNGFGEETVTAIEAINIIVEEDYVAKAKHIHELMHAGLVELQKKHPGLIREVRGCGALNGIVLNSEHSLLQSVAKLMPVDLARDDRFVQKLMAAALVDHLYQAHQILTIFGQNREIPLLLSPPLIIEDEQIRDCLHAIDKSLSKGLVALCAQFFRSKFIGKFLTRFKSVSTRPAAGGSHTA